jgi:hypothetical protein
MSDNAGWLPGLARGFASAQGRKGHKGIFTEGNEDNEDLRSLRYLL